MKYDNLKDKILLADREYIGEDWFCFLKDHAIDFVIRLRKKNYKEALNAAEGLVQQSVTARPVDDELVWKLRQAR